VAKTVREIRNIFGWSMDCAFSYSSTPLMSASGYFCCSVLVEKYFADCEHNGRLGASYTPL
jgi:hypothetical protein